MCNLLPECRDKRLKKFKNSRSRKLPVKFFEHVISFRSFYNDIHLISYFISFSFYFFYLCFRFWLLSNINISFNLFSNFSIYIRNSDLILLIYRLIVFLLAFVVDRSSYNLFLSLVSLVFAFLFSRFSCSILFKVPEVSAILDIYDLVFRFNCQISRLNPARRTKCSHQLENVV
jgi:hypothetical protein